MKFLKNIYLNGMEAFGEMPSWKKDWRWIAIYSVCIYAVVLAFRLSFAGRWDHPELWVNGERILATHDAYYWLAKAKGVGWLVGYPLAEVTSYIQRITGLGFGTIGFWAPAFVTSLVGVICYLWGWLIAGRNAGIIAGLTGSLTPGFFYRSRLGYFDTDMFTLLVPMLTAWLFAYWASFHIRRGWFLFEKTISIDESHSLQSLWVAFFIGLSIRATSIWHHDILNLSIFYFFLTFAVIICIGRPEKKAVAFYGLIIVLLTAYPGTAFGHLGFWPFSLISLPELGVSARQFACFSGVSCSLLIIFWHKFALRRQIAVGTNVWMVASFLVVAIVATNIVQEPVLGSIRKLASYYSSAGNIEGANTSIEIGPIYPSILQTIIEAKRVALSVIIERGAFTNWLGWVALLSAVVIMVFRPAGIFLLPLIVLHLASVKIGIRFSMFGGAALMVFLGVGVHWLAGWATKRFPRQQLVGFCIQVILGCVFLVYCHIIYSNIPLTPVIPRQHAEALIQLGEESPSNSMVWTWWDWGYASQYYASRETVVDGGKHAGRDVFPVAFAMSSDTPIKANRMVAFSSQYPAKTPYDLGLFPATNWDDVPRSKVSSTLQKQLAHSSYPVVSPQYIVVTWKDLNIAKWITYFGNWNLENGTTKEAAINSFDPGQLGFNIQQGSVMSRKGRGGLVSDITILDKGSSETEEYYMNKLSPRLLPKKRHLVINMVSRQSVLMDRIAYRSMMTRLLTGDPNDPEITPYFKLVVDKLPFARIYEVVQ